MTTIICPICHNPATIKQQNNDGYMIQYTRIECECLYCDTIFKITTLEEVD